MSILKDSYYQEKINQLQLNGDTYRLIEFEECEINGCSLIDCKFEKCKFISCSFTDCIISSVGAGESRFMDVSFSRCKVMGFNWVKAVRIQDLNFSDCQINYSNFKTLEIPKLKIVNCEAKEVDFTEADLSGGIFTNTDFEGSVFFKTNLAEADFRNAKNYAIDVRFNTLRKTRFSSPEVITLLGSLDIIID